MSPTKLSRMKTTTDTMSILCPDNYDFMNQTLILYSQITTGELHDQNPNSGTYGDHKCENCLLKIDEPTC